MDLLGTQHLGLAGVLGNPAPWASGCTFLPPPKQKILYETLIFVTHAHTQEDLLLACDEVKSMGESMHQTALEFSYDTLDEDRREMMVTASRSLLMAVTRLMVAVDAVDIQNMFRTSSRVCVCLPL